MRGRGGGGDVMETCGGISMETRNDRIQEFVQYETTGGGRILPQSPTRGVVL